MFQTKNFHDDIFNFAQPNVAVINTVNCMGNSGKGLALQFREKFPVYEQDYREKCRSGIIKTGSVDFFRDELGWICSFPTKHHWRNPSQLEWIELGLRDMFGKIPEEVNVIVLPPLGCGLGGLKQKDVYELILKSIKEAEKKTEKEIHVITLFDEISPSK